MHRYIGFIPGDPTVEGVPDELPASSVGSDVTVIDLERMSYEDLMKLSRESAPDPLGALLPAQPGILPEREARLTGVPTPHLLIQFYVLPTDI